MKRTWVTHRGPDWTERELDYLAEAYGLVADEKIAAHLGRSRNAIVIAAKRKLGGINRKAAFYCSQEVARVLRVDSKTVVYWLGRGWLEGKRAPFKQGPYRVWSFSEEHILICLRRRPWLVDPAKMLHHYFRSVVEEEYGKDPWYTCDQAAPLLGRKDINAIHRYIRRGWLPAERKPGGPHQGIWVIRHSAIQNFLANDPRPARLHRLMSQGRRETLMEKAATKVATVWELRCPLCHQVVEVRSSDLRHGPQVREAFVAVHNNGTPCHHGEAVSLTLSKAVAKLPNNIPKRD